jgi:hypothetical protein
MRSLTYWLVVLSLTAATAAAFIYAISNGWSARGFAAFVATLVLAAITLSYSRSMRNKASPPIPR